MLYVPALAVEDDWFNSKQEAGCRLIKAGEELQRHFASRTAQSGLVSQSCIRSGAFEPMGTVDLVKGER